MRRVSINLKVLLIGGVAAIALAIGLGVTLRGVTAVGGLRTEGHSIPIQGAAAARVELVVDSGELRLGVGSSRLLDGAFTFNVDEWEPKISYQVISREGVLLIEQGEPDGPFPVVYGEALNTWNLLLTPEIPLDLRVELGDAAGSLALGELQLMNLAITGDGGDIVVDLTGYQASGLHTALSTRGGDLVLTLPFGVAAEVIVESGNVVRADGIVAEDDVYITDSGSASPQLTVIVDAGSGDVTLLTAPADPPSPAVLGSPAR